MNTVPYLVEIRAGRLASGWELTLSNGVTLEVGTLDEAPRRVRSYLDNHQPDLDHRSVAVAVVIAAEAPEAPASPVRRTGRPPQPERLQPQRSGGGRHRL